MNSLLYGISSLERYYDQNTITPKFAYYIGDLAELAGEDHELEYPGVEEADAVLTENDESIYIKCIDSVEDVPEHPFSVCNLLYDSGRNVFYDKPGCYPELRKRELRLISDSFQSYSWRLNLESAVLISRYGFSLSEELLENVMTGTSGYSEEPSVLYQNLMLEKILTGKNPANGLSFLKKTGFIDEFWPELAALSGLDHSKEYHPEGDVWKHTLETFSYRKTTDLTLSLALLLHDIGKPDSKQADGNRFDRHAQIGSSTAFRFMKKLGFESEMIKNVCYLVERHMLPAAIPRLPAYRIESDMSSSLFPILLEVFRCDLLSTFRSPEPYYDACRTYKSFLKNKKNPFRSADGKKLLRMYVE